MKTETPFAKWRERMGEKLDLGRPLGKFEAAKQLGYNAPNWATKLDRMEILPVYVALACAALEADLQPIK